MNQTPTTNLFLIDLYHYIRYFLSCLAGRGYKDYEERES